MSQLDDIKKRAEKATEGPWQVWDDAPAHRSAYVETTRSTDGEHKEEITDWCKPADADFIAHARTDVPKLVAALEAVLDKLDNYPIPSKLADPTGEILSGMEGLEGIIRSAIEEALS